MKAGGAVGTFEDEFELDVSGVSSSLNPLSFPCKELIMTQLLVQNLFMERCKTDMP